MRRGAHIALALALALAPGCFSFTWERHRELEPIAEADLAWAEAGELDLDTALARLGAPTHVWEQPAGGMALAWGWRNQRELGLQFSIPITDRNSASFTYTGVDARLRGLVVVFDAEGCATLVRRGNLAELSAALSRPRPFLDPRWASRSAPGG